MSISHPVYELTGWGSVSETSCLMTNDTAVAADIRCPDILSRDTSADSLSLSVLILLSWLYAAADVRSLDAGVRMHAHVKTCIVRARYVNIAIVFVRRLNYIFRSVRIVHDKITFTSVHFQKSAKEDNYAIVVVFVCLSDC